MAHAHDIIAVLRVRGRTAKATVGGAVGGVTNEVNTEHAAVGGGGVLVILIQTSRQHNMQAGIDEALTQNKTLQKQ